MFLYLLQFVTCMISEILLLNLLYVLIFDTEYESYILSFPLFTFGNIDMVLIMQLSIVTLFQTKH